MTAVTLVGWIASAVGMTVGMPQLIKLIRTRNVDGLSLFAWQATLVANLIWLGHGIRIEQLPHVVTNLAGLATTLPLVLLLAHSHRLGRFAALWPPLAAAAVVIGIDLAWGTAAFGMAAIAPMLCAIAGQSVELVRAAHVRGVSAVFTLGAFVNQSLWLAFAFLIADAGSIIATSIGWVTTGFNLVWYCLRRLGLRAFFARSDVSAVAAARNA